MYLSKIVLNIKNKDVIYNMNNSVYWHKRVMEGFLDNLESVKNPREKLGILFRKEITDKGSILYVQSLVQPNWYGKTWVKMAEVKSLEKVLNSFREGKQIHFDLLCTPYRKNKETNKIRAIKDKVQRIEWFNEKGYYNGFKVIQCKNEIKDRPLYNICDSENVVLYGVCLKGILEIVDVEKFINFYEIGVGRQKSYGLGMLMLY